MKFIYLEILFLSGVIIHGLYFFGPPILSLLCFTYIFSTVAELISLKTPISCFGVKYRYNLVQPLFASKIFLLGVYPLEVSFAWVILKYISFCLGILIVSAFSLPIIAEIVLVPLILVSMDFILDPVAVNYDKLWHWEKGSFYFGIPLRNFLGWYLVGLLSTLLFVFTVKSRPLSFNIFYLLPIIAYAFILDNVPKLYRRNKFLTVIGVSPAVAWIILSTVGLIIMVYY